MLAGMVFQEWVESEAARVVEVPFAAPTLRLIDFLEGRVSTDLPDSSYPMPLVPVAFDQFLPGFVLDPVRSGLGKLCRRYPELYCDEAIVVAPESRSSSPIRFVRDRDTLQCMPQLYAIGEGAGYAGGIMSAAIDGMRAAEAWLLATCAAP